MVLLPAVFALALAAPAQAQTTVPLDQQVQQADPQAASPDHPDQKPDPQEPKADAKEPPTPAHTGLHALFGDLGEDLKHLPALQNLYILAGGGALALAAHPADQSFNAKLLSHYDAVNTAFAPGKYFGDTPEQVAMSLGTYAFGRWRDEPKVAHLGMDLLQAQILSEILIEPLKFAVGRRRPDDSNSQSFPSGHASVTFAAATVIERHLGWRKAALGYAIASYVAMSRIHDNRHYLSDVIFGAAVGTVAGRTVVHHQADYWAFTPVAIPGGGAALMVSRVRWDR
jgi:membrane-associated phospholipid phosphatase